jgi:hypothetical protein
MVIQMTDHPLREPRQIRADCARKLQPIDTGVMFMAILAALHDEDRTTPTIEELLITSDRYILARTAGEMTHKIFIVAEADLIQTCTGLQTSLDWTVTSWVTCLAEWLKPDGLCNWTGTYFMARKTSRPISRTVAGWSKQIRLAIADARGAEPFGRLIGEPITDANLFHLVPLVCLKFRGRKLVGREADRVT